MYFILTPPSPFLTRTNLSSKRSFRVLSSLVFKCPKHWGLRYFPCCMNTLGPSCSHVYSTSSPQQMTWLHWSDLLVILRNSLACTLQYLNSFAEFWGNSVMNVTIPAPWGKMFSSLSLSPPRPQHVGWMGPERARCLQHQEAICELRVFCLFTWKHKICHLCE